MFVRINKILAFILVASMLFPTLPVHSIVSGEWSEDIDVSPQYEIDTFYMNEINGSLPCSGGAYNKWNRNINAVMANIVEPGNESNTVTSYKSEVNKTGELFKNVYISPVPKNETIVISQDIVIPSPTEGIDTASAVIKMFGSDALHLTYNASTNKFDGVFYDKSFEIAHDEWLRLYNILTPGEDGKSVTVYAQLSGNMQDQNGSALFFMQTSINLNILNEFYSLAVSGKNNCEGLVYIDNNRIMQPKDFGEATVIIEPYNDYYSNFNLQSQVKVELYHTMDLTTFDLSQVRLCNKLSKDIPCTSLTLAHDAQTLVFDFSENKLPKFEEIYVCFGDKVRDLHGNIMFEPTVVFETFGDNGEIPAPRDVIEVPANGFVMPDQWNTGYRCELDELVPLAEKYPEIVENHNIIDETIARKYDYEFSYFTHTEHLYVTATSPIYIHDFYMNGGGFTNGKSGRLTSSSRLTIAWGEGENSYEDFFGGSNLTISHCYIHDVRADHMKGSSGQIVEFNYFREGGTRNPGAHADVVQFMGDWSAKKKAGMHSYFYGNRFDAPELAYEHASNCIFFYKPEPNTVGYIDIQAIGNWFNGGGYTSALVSACDISYNQQIHYNDNKWGYGYRFGVMSYDGVWLPTYGGSYENNGFVTTLETGTVAYYSVLGGDADRVYSAEDMVGSEARIMVNFANYMTVARGYAIEVEVLDREGNVVISAEKIGTIRRYTPVKEYLVADNLRDTGYRVDGSIIYELIEIPDFPHDVPEYVELTGLPANMEDHTISVKVYDTTAGKELIRISNLGFELYDDCRPAQPSDQDTYYSVTFQDDDGNVIAIQPVKAGEDAFSPTPPTKDGFVFVGWSASISNVQSNITVTAKYLEQILEFYEVTFKDQEGNILSVQTVEKGFSAISPTPPAIEGFEFVGWSESFSNVTGDISVFPIYQKIDSRSQALQMFEKSVIAIENDVNSSFSVRLVKLQEAYSAWLKIDEMEEGARDVCARFEEAVRAFNRDVEIFNQTMQDAEKASQSLIQSPM